MADLNIDSVSVTRDISPNDTMFKGDEGHYFGVGQSALDCIRCSLLAAGIAAADVNHILDLPCGHGRVLRHLKQFFPGAVIVACDLLHDAVDYCAKTFGAIPAYSDEDPARIRLGHETFDLIWVGYRSTQLDAPRWVDFLEFLRRSLRPGGIVVFTTHGREVYHRMVQASFDYLLPYWRTTTVRYAYEHNGFGYANYLWSPSYGISLSSPGWVFHQVARVKELRIVHFSERAWDRHHDVYACVREPAWQVCHPSISTWTFLKQKIREHVRPKGWRA